VFPDADNFKLIDEISCIDPELVIETQYAALNNGEIIGAVLNILSTKGYGGAMKVLAGVSAGGFVTGVKILAHSETPGLGANAASPSYFVDKTRGLTFYGQFKGKIARDPFEVHNDIAAVTASTITSRAVSAAVKAAALSVSEWFGQDVHAVSGASKGADAQGAGE
jgi:electron transport complex protein RnfG